MLAIRQSEQQNNQNHLTKGAVSLETLGAIHRKM